MGKSLPLGFFCILLTILLVGYSIRLQKQIVIQEARANMANQLGYVEMDLNRAFYGLDQVFLGLENYLSHFPQDDPPDPPEVRRILDDLALKNDYISGLLIAEASGQVLNWNNIAAMPNLSERPYINVQQNNVVPGLYIGPPQPSYVNEGQWIFGISKAIRRSDGSLDKILAAIIDVKYFYRQYRDLVVQSGSFLTITSPDGTIYTRLPGHDEYVGKKLEGLSAQQQLTSDLHNELHTEEISDTGNRLIVMRQLDSYPLIVKVGRMENTVMAPWAKIAWSFTLFGALVSLVLLWMTLRLRAFEKHQIALNERLMGLASIDPLTELTNQSSALEQAAMEIKKARRAGLDLAVLLLDLDHELLRAGTVEGTSGKPLLAAIAELLKGACRESDIISHRGNAIFLLILPGTNLEGAVADAKKLRKLFAEQTFKIASNEVRLASAFGVTQWGDDEEDLSGTLERAEAALEEALKSGAGSIRAIPSNLRGEALRSKDIWLPQEH